MMCWPVSERVGNAKKTMSLIGPIVGAVWLFSGRDQLPDFILADHSIGDFRFQRIHPDPIFGPACLIMLHQGID
jgi:hypothetical protein